MYGPGGSYSFFAGRDATRAFVTGCFDTDLNGDLRGVEQMFMPVDDEMVAATGEWMGGVGGGEGVVRKGEAREAGEDGRSGVMMACAPVDEL